MDKVTKKLLKLVPVNKRQFLHAYATNDEVKTPKTKAKHLGIEIECFGPCSATDVYNEILERDLEEYVNVGEDGSIDTYGSEFAHEFRLLIPEKGFSAILKRICTMLHDLDLEVNDSCGLHVHLDCRGRSSKTVVKRLEAAQELLFSVVDEERTMNSYCEFRTNYNQNRRYLAINTQSLEEHETVEVRLHQGTVDFTDINQWVKLLLYIVGNKQMGKIKTKEAAVKWMRSKPLKEYLKMKIGDWYDWEYFQPNYQDAM